MAKRTYAPTPTRHANIQIEDVPAKIEKLKRRHKEVREMPAPANSAALSSAALAMATKVNATYDEVYGAGTVEAEEARINPNHFRAMYSPCPWPEELEIFENARGHLAAALQARIEVFQEKLEVPQRAEPALHTRSEELSDDVFIVHGHDEQAREEVARLIAKCGLNPIILHEQASGARTVIEKLERYSNVSFAVVLLTPDDVGGPAPQNAAGTGELKPRARQNVIAELFYFIGKLGRDKVCALKRGEIEIPSDIGGVAYTEMDAAGGWKTALLKELEAVGHAIDWRKALT